MAESFDAGLLGARFEETFEDNAFLDAYDSRYMERKGGKMIVSRLFGKKTAKKLVAGLCVGLCLFTVCTTVPQVLAKEASGWKEAVYLGVEGYGRPEVNKDTKPDFKYRFKLDGKKQETVLSIQNGKKDADGNYTYPIQNKLKEGYTFKLKIQNKTVVDVKEVASDDTEEYEPVVSGTPGKKTLKNFLSTALEPAGTTLYIYGGGWNWQDDAASVQAKSIGVSTDWVDFFNSQNAAFHYKNPNAAKSYYPFGEYNEYYYAGLDCSGYVGWVLYNTFHKTSGKAGYVQPASSMARTLATQGWGEWKHEVAVPDGSAGTALKPGDIISMDGHVWISLGTCKDGSVLIAHSSPTNSRKGNPGGGVQISAIGSAKSCEAYRLADQYNAEYYEDWYKRYPTALLSPSVYFSWESENAGLFRWNTKGKLTDPEKLQNKTPKQVLAQLF